MSIIRRRDGFLGLFGSACLVADIGLPQFQQNAYLSSIAEPQCWQTPPLVSGADTLAGADAGACVSMSLGWISGCAGAETTAGTGGGVAGAGAIAGAAGNTGAYAASGACISLKRTLRGRRFG